MKQYSTTQTINFPVIPTERALIVTTNGGSLEVAVYDGAAFVVTDTISTDGGQVLHTSGLRIRFTPAGGCVFSVEESKLS